MPRTPTQHVLRAQRKPGHDQLAGCFFLKNDLIQMIVSWGKAEFCWTAECWYCLSLELSAGVGSRHPSETFLSMALECATRGSHPASLSPCPSAAAGPGGRFLPFILPAPLANTWGAQEPSLQLSHVSVPRRALSFPSWSPLAESQPWQLCL